MKHLSGLGAALALLALPAFSAGAAATNNPYGACAHVTRGEPPARTCALMRQAGLGWVRSDFDWRTLERRPGEWDFAPFDAVVAACEANGVQLLPILGYSVPWAHPAHDHLDAWGAYVRRVVTHYGRRLPVLEVWNEENIPGFWKDPNPTNYLAVLRRTYEVAKAHDPSLRIAFGGTAGVPFDFIEEVYRLGGAKFFDIMNIHPYSHPRAPEGAMDANIERLRDLMARYGDAEKPLWITEVGWPTHAFAIRGGDLLAAGLRAADPAKTAWRTLYVPAHADEAFNLQALLDILPPGSSAEVCPAAHLRARLARGDVDAVVYPFTEDYAADSVEAVADFVKAGGVLVDFGGMPLWNAYRADATGRARRVANHPAWQDRRRLRIHEIAWWVDRRYPEAIPVAPTSAAAGVKPPPCGFKGQRFLTACFLKPGDAFIPLLSAQTNGVDLVAAAVYKFNSDYKGAVVVNALMGQSAGTSDEARQARMVARALGIAFAEGVENFFWYEFTQPDVDPTDPESYFGIVHDNFAPKPAYGAYWTFVDQRPVGSVQRPGPWRSADGSLYFPQWTRPDGRAAGLVWTLGAPGARRLAFTSARMEFRDVKGARVRPTRDGDAYLLPLSDAPLYFVGGALKAEPFAEAVLPVEPGEAAAAYLERLRERGAAARAADPRATVTGGGAHAGDAFAQAFLALGEAEEVDAWQVADPTPERVARLRAAFDGAGGKAVRLVDLRGRPLEKPLPACAARWTGTPPEAMLAAGSGRVVLFSPDGKVRWSRTGCGNVHQVQEHGGYVYYANGDLYRCRLPATRAELVYRPRVRTGGGVLGFEVQPNGDIVLALNASGEIVELDGKTGRETVRFAVNTARADGKEPGAHTRLRMVHKTPAGTYLVCCAGASAVREYGADGRLVWEQAVPALAFDARRRANGNTLVAHLTGVTEYTPDHRAVWSFACADAPALNLAFLCGIQERANGNLVVGTRANGAPDATRATAFEVTRDKRIVWAHFPAQDRNMMTVQRPPLK